MLELTAALRGACCAMPRTNKLGLVTGLPVETALTLTIARRSCAVLYELTARRSTLARRANQQLTSLLLTP